MAEVWDLTWVSEFKFGGLSVGADLGADGDTGFHLCLSCEAWASEGQAPYVIFSALDLSVRV